MASTGPTFRKWLRCFGVAVAVALGVLPAPAANGTWTNLSGGSWAATNNWLGGTIATGQDAVAEFSTLSLPANATVSLNGARTIGSAIFGDQNATKHNWSLNTGTGGPLTLSVSAGTPSLTVNAGITASIGATLAGSSGFTKAGPGTLALSATESVTGPIAVNGGTLAVSGANNAVSTLGNTASVSINSGGTVSCSGDNSLFGYNPPAQTVTLNSGGKLTCGANSIHIGPVVLQGGELAGDGSSAWGGWYFDANVTATGGATSTVSAVKVVIPPSSTRTFTVDAGATVLVTGNFKADANGTATGALTKSGAGEIILAGTNAHAGATAISAGALSLGTSGILSNTPIITVASGALFDVSAQSGFFLRSSQTLAGNGTVLGALTDPASGLGTISPGTTGTAGTLTLDTLNFSAGKLALNFDLAPTFGVGGGTNDLLIVTNLMLSSTATNVINVSFPGGMPPAGGIYTLIQYGTVNVPAGSVSTLVCAQGYQLTNDTNANAIKLTAPGPANLVWVGDALSNIWNVAGAPNWSNGGGSATFNQGDSVAFDDSGSATPAVNITTTVMPAGLLVSNFTRDYTLGGTGKISGAVTLVKTGSGSLTLQSANDNTGGEQVNGGTLRVSGGTVGSGAMIVNAGATVSGSGSHRGPVSVSGTVSPGDSAGTLTTGAQTWLSGGACILEIQSATNSTAMDYLQCTGPIEVQATPANPFVIRLVSLAANGSPGPVADFDPTRSYTWWVANPFGGVSNVVSGNLQIDTSAFSNPLAGGQFSVAVAGTSLVVQFTPAPPLPSLTGQVAAGGGVQLASITQPGQYQVFLAASNLVPPVVWVPVATNFVGSNGLSTSTVNPVAGVAQQFYRAGLLASEVITVTNFGIQPDTLADATVPVQQAIAAIAQRAGRPTVLRFPNGRYDFYTTNAARVIYYISNTASESENPDPTKTIGLWLKGLTNVVVDGDGSLLMFHGKMTTIVLDQCQDVELRNLHEDFARPTMSEVKVTALNGNTMDVDVHPDSTYTISGGHLTWVGEGWTSSNPPMTQEFAPETDTTWRNGWNPVSSASSVQELAPFKLRLNYSSAPSATVGHWYQMRETIRDQVGVFIHESRNITLRNSGFHYTHGLGIVGQYTENLTLDTVMMEPRAESGRTCSAFADFFQVSGCRGKVQVWNCRFIGAHDDPINTHGTHLRIVAQPATNQVQVRFMHSQSYGFDAFFPGDQVDFIRKATLRVFGTANVQAVQRIDGRNILLTLDQNVPGGVVLNSDCVENATWTPELEVRGCYFSRYPTRGILVTTRRPVVIERNVFNRSPMAGVLIADDDASWYESGMVADVLIRENQFLNCSSPVIQLAPENTTVDINNPVHSNVRIQQNIFRHTGSSLLSAKSTELIRFEANRIQRTPVVAVGSLLSFNACRNSTVTNNILEPY